MKLKDLSPVLHSSRGGIVHAIVYDIDEHFDIEDNCSVDYAVKHYGDWHLERISADGDCVVLHVRRETAE